jgi:glycosyltransferase involved in cell wall biosynthesis
MITGIESADAIVCFHANDADTLTGFFPKLRERVTVVPQGVEALPVTGEDHFGIAHEAFVLLLPAALRPVKQVEFPIQALSNLAEGDPTLQLVIAGGVIDNDYAAAIRLLLSAFPLARWLGEVPHERMGDLYSRADLVLNCSRSESMSNSLMEAMALGKPVLASDIPGNRSLVQNGDNGWLYDSEADLRKKITQIRGNASLRQTTGERAREYMQKKFSPWEEAKGYLSLYRRLVIK